MTSVTTSAETIKLVGSCTTCRGGDLREVYMATVSPACTGGGSFTGTNTAWTITSATPNQVELAVQVVGTKTCLDGGVAPVTCEASKAIALGEHCGPDITDQYILALNRVIGRLRARATMKESYSMVDGALSALSAATGGPAVPAWDEKRLGPYLDQDLLVSNGPWIQFRPYAQAFGKEPPFWGPGRCPSCGECAATATILGRCVESYLTDALMYGLVAGLLGLDVGVMAAAGATAKKLLGHWNEESKKGALPAWDIGHDMGAHAASDDAYRVTRGDQFLNQLLGLANKRRCAACNDKVAITGVNWSSMDWSEANTSAFKPAGGQGKDVFIPPEPE